MRVPRPLVALAFAASAVVALPTGCGGRVQSDVDAGVGIDSGIDSSVDSGGCTGGLVACGASCVDTSKDSAHCGSCSNACASNQACVSGSCAANCGPTQTKCGSSCVSTTTDPANCGACNKVCPNGFACVASQCIIVCSGNQTKCNGNCVDTQVDNTNCGTCGTICDKNAGELCQQGLCCGAGTTNCGGKCIDTLSDPLNCGGCKNVCPPQTPSCAGGKCTALQILGKLGSQTFYKIPVTGTMTDTNVYNACVAAGLTVGCSSSNCPAYTDNLCTPTQESSCGNPMKSLATVLGCASPSNCAPLNGVYQYMGHKWQGDAACGVENATWCSTGTTNSNRWALCLQ